MNAEPKNKKPKTMLDDYDPKARLKSITALLNEVKEGKTTPAKCRGFVKGCVGLNIMPDRNWNIADEKTKKIKVSKLGEIIKKAREHGIPVIAGTELNSYGQKFVDDFDSAELQPYLEDFRAGAFMVYGHTCLGKYSGKGYMSG